MIQETDFCHQWFERDRFWIPIPGLSLSDAYKNNVARTKTGKPVGGRSKTKAYNKYIKEWTRVDLSVRKSICALGLEFSDLIEECPDRFFCHVHYSFVDVWMNSTNPFPKKKDASNYIKTAEDCFFSCLGIDDSWSFRTTAEKIHCDNKSLHGVIIDIIGGIGAKRKRWTGA